MTILSSDLQVGSSTFNLPNYELFFFLQRIQIQNKENIFFAGGALGGVSAGRGGVARWTGEQAQSDLPLQLLRSWGHNNAFII